MLNWKFKLVKNIKINFISTGSNSRKIINIIETFFKFKNINLLKRDLKKIEGFYAFVASKKNFKLAAVDRVRSFPILYNKKNIFYFGKKIQNLKLKKNIIDRHALHFFLLSGYTPNEFTLNKNLKQMEAGDLIIFKGKEKIKTNLIDQNYIIKKKSPTKLFNEFDNILNKIFIRMKKNFSNKQIILSLSGGYDSRIILSKMIENKISNFILITYGAKNNYDSIIAKQITDKLKKELIQIHLKKSFIRKNFYKRERKLFWKYSHNFTSLPNMQEYMAVKYLKSKNLIKKNSVFINGQTGDFISGEHLSESNKIPKIINKIIDKHFNLSGFEKINPKIIDKIKDTILKNFKKNKISKNIKMNEYFWEWKERQSKYVVNQQRTYEYFGYTWYLPLWEKEITNFFTSIPSSLLVNQKFYKYYLEKYNYKNLFDAKYNKKNYTNWIGITKFLILPAQIIGLIFGKKYKNLFYNFFKYFDKYSYHYQIFTYLTFLKNLKRIRNSNSLFMEKFKEENFKL